MQALFLSFMAKERFVIIGAVLALVIFVLGFIGPWYVISGNFMGFSASANIGLMETTISAGAGEASFAAQIESPESETTMLFAIVTIILAIIAFIGVVGSAFQFGKKDLMQRIGEIFGFITFLVAIITITYYVVNLPDMSNLESLGLSTGYGLGFYLFLVGAIAVFGTNIWSRLVKS